MQTKRILLYSNQKDFKCKAMKALDTLMVLKPHWREADIVFSEALDDLKVNLKSDLDLIVMLNNNYSPIVDFMIEKNSPFTGIVLLEQSAVLTVELLKRAEFFKSLGDLILQQMFVVLDDQLTKSGRVQQALKSGFALKK